MIKFVVVVMAIFLIPIMSIVGKNIYDAITENYTFVNTVTNLTPFPWLVPYARSMWWLLPIGAVIIIILYVMKKSEPQPPQMPTFRQPKMPKKQAPPPIFIKR